MGLYGGNRDHKQQIISPTGAPGGAYYDTKQYMKNVIKTMDLVRNEFGNELEIMHDIHERLSPIDSLSLAKELEPYHLFYLEDPVRPDQVEYLKYFREQTTVPIAIGELFTNSLEWKNIIVNHLVDYIRMHISDIGGITPAIKVAHLAQAFQVQTSWHGPEDLSPIGMAAQMHLDMNLSNFGIQEFMDFNDAEKELFPGCPIAVNGYAYLNDSYGIGVGFDEKLAKKYPAKEDVDYSWLFARTTDGTAVRP